MRAHYVAHYVYPNGLQDRWAAPSANSKIEYVAQKLTAIGFKVTILSAARSQSTRGAPRTQTDVRRRGVTAVYQRSLPWGGRVRGLLSLVFGDLMLLRELISSTTRGETVVAYHSLDLRLVLVAGRLLRRLNVILQVEEVYSQAGRAGLLWRLLERLQVASADGYILSTELLERVIPDSRPRAICHGVYQSFDIAPVVSSDMKVRCVYAGTLDPLKGGAARAVALSRYLGERYEVHILGFGSAPDLDSLRRQISELPCPDRVILHSPLEGQEFLNFLGSCDIGLSTQSTADAFNESSFPSKILSYLGAGLPVVSVPAPAVVSSQVSHAISIAESDDPRDLALAIRSLAQDTRARSPEETLARLDIDFEHSLRQVVMDAKGAQV